MQDEWRLHPQLRLSGGLRFDHYATFRDPVKPRLALIYQPRERTTVKVIYGEAFRAPNVFENYYIIPGSWRPGLDLRPEEVARVEGVVEQLLGRRVRVAASVFTYAIRDLIDFQSVPDADGLVSFANVNDADVSGVESEVEAKWPTGVHARVSYTYSHATNGLTRAWLSNSPRHLTQSVFSMPVGRPLTIAAQLATP